MACEINLNRFPELTRLEFGNSQHIALLKTEAKSLFFSTKKGPFRMRIWEGLLSGGGRFFLNGQAVFLLAREMELRNCNIEIGFYPFLRAGQGIIQAGRFYHYGEDQEEKNVHYHRVLLSSYGVMEKYEGFGLRDGLNYSINHTFFHELSHVREQDLGLPSDYDQPWKGKNWRNYPAEVFARQKMEEVLLGRKELLPLLVI